MCGTLQGIGAEAWRKLLWEYEPGVVIIYGTTLQSTEATIW